MIFVLGDNWYLAQVIHDELTFRVLCCYLGMQTYQWKGRVHWSQDPHWKEFSLRDETIGLNI